MQKILAVLLSLHGQIPAVLCVIRLIVLCKEAVIHTSNHPNVRAATRSEWVSPPDCILAVAVFKNRGYTGEQWCHFTLYTFTVYWSTVLFDMPILYTSTLLHFRGKCCTFYSTIFIWQLLVKSYFLHFKKITHCAFFYVIWCSTTLIYRVDLKLV